MRYVAKMFIKAHVYVLVTFILGDIHTIWCASKPYSGALDVSFGNNGIVVTPFETTAQHVIQRNNNQQNAQQLAIQTIPELTQHNMTITGLTLFENDIIAIAKNVNNTTLPSIIASYGQEGKLSSLFDNRGYLIMPASISNAVAVTTHLCSEIVVGGASIFPYLPKQFQISTPLFKDTSSHWKFQNDARLEFPHSMASEAHALAIDSQMRIILGGSVTKGLGNQFALSRIHATGSIDSTFGFNGFVHTCMSSSPSYLERITSIVICPGDNKIIVAGQAFINGEQRAIIARYTEKGMLDTTFGMLANPHDPLGARTGTILPDFTPFTQTSFRHDSATSLILCYLEGEWKLIVGGFVLNNSGTFSITLARYTYDGSLDTNFGQQINGHGTGMVVDTLDSFCAKAYALGLDSHNRLIVAGEAMDSLLAFPQQIAPQFVIARYDPQGLRDATFGNHGKIVTEFEGLGAGARAIVIDYEDNILVGGYSFSSHGIARCSLVRYHG